MSRPKGYNYSNFVAQKEQEEEEEKRDKGYGKGKPKGKPKQVTWGKVVRVAVTVEEVATFYRIVGDPQSRFVRGPRPSKGAGPSFLLIDNYQPLLSIAKCNSKRAFVRGSVRLLVCM